MRIKKTEKGKVKESARRTESARVDGRDTDIPKQHRERYSATYCNASETMPNCNTLQHIATLCCTET